MYLGKARDFLLSPVAIIDFIIELNVWFLREIHLEFDPLHFKYSTGMAALGKNTVK